jgi:alkylhydroperoxidase/carboxymuconolactone decarboxylase family protein YurZ
MTNKSNIISNAFQTFMTEAPEHAKAWGGMIQTLGQASALDAKTSQLAYLAVLAALNRASGIPFHVLSAKEAGATRDEIISAVLIGLPAAGHIVTQALPVALAAYDQEA